MRIRHFTSADAKEIAALFHGSVHSISATVYSKEQLEAWAPTPPDYVMWKARLERTQPFLAVIEDLIVGFLELEPDGHINCLYVHKDYQRQGIANALLVHASKKAIKNGCQMLYVEASITAKPFFQKKGWSLVSTNSVKRNNHTLINYTMRGVPQC